jgi:hypothetical protein
VLSDGDGNVRQTIDSSGNVGIGTTSPTQKLTLGTGFVQTGNGVGGAGGVWFPYSSDASGRTWRARTDLVSYGDWGLEQSTTQTGTTFATKFLIDANGGVRINNTSNATFSAQLNTQFTSGVQCGIYLKVTDTSSSQSMMIFGNSSSDAVGSITASGSATSYQTSSDYRLKEDIAPMTGALAKVALLKPVIYKWKVDGAAGQGFIAHELQEVVPDCVGGEKDAVTTYIDEDGNEATRPVYQGVDTSFLVATLTAAIQELKAEFDAYKSTHP